MSEVELTFHRTIKVSPSLLSVLPPASLSSIVDDAAVEHRAQIAAQLKLPGALAKCYEGRQIPTVHGVAIEGEEKRFVLVSRLITIKEGHFFLKTVATTQEGYVRDILGLTY